MATLLTRSPVGGTSPARDSFVRWGQPARSSHRAPGSAAHHKAAPRAPSRGEPHPSGAPRSPPMSQEAVPVEPHEAPLPAHPAPSTSEYVTTPEGTRELHIFFGIKEITIDEPDPLSFGETLLQQ